MEIEISRLSYEIHNFSSFSSSYLPENIRDDNPSSQISRWSSESNAPVQFITLRLQKPAIVKKILFGKYEKSHVCNLKKFKIYGGLEENSMFQIFEGGLKNDNIPEVFELKHKIFTEDEGERDIAIKYLKIVPLLSFGPSFNFSIWYVELQGIESDVYVNLAMRNFNDQNEKTAIRLVLKHLRDKGYTNAFSALEKEAKISLEDNQITELFQYLVEEGDFMKSEEIMEKFVKNRDYIEEYMSNQKYKANYNEIKSIADDDDVKPSCRIDAGYCYDSESQIVYMFGGLNDETSEDLNDFWQYDLKTKRWSIIHENSSITARHGQKMIFDSISKQIFIIGRRVSRTNGNVNDSYKNDFYLYDTHTKAFLLICEDTFLMNGPPLICDHQIILNSKDRTIYVFGGRIVNKSDETNESLSGAYSYHIPTNTWNLICVDVSNPNSSNPEINSMKSRLSHAMIFDDIRRKIYIIGGKRGKEACNDNNNNNNNIMQFDIDSNTFNIVQLPTVSHVAAAVSPTTPSSSSSSSLDSINLEKLSGLCFATMNSNKGELYILMKDNLWMYALATNEFSMIHKVRHTPSGKDSSLETTSTAFSHGEVNFFLHSYNSLYVFKSDSSVYSIELVKPSNESVLNYCKYLIRRQQYEEMALENSIRALTFLRNNLSETIDRNDINQVNDFHKLASLLFCNKFPINSPNNNNDNNDDNGKQQYQEGEMSSGQRKIRNQRTILFNKLTSLLPKSKCQPQQSLLNFINV